MFFVEVNLTQVRILRVSSLKTGGFGDLLFDVSDNITPTNTTLILYPYIDGYVSMTEPNISFSTWQNSDLKVWSDWDRLSHGVRWVMHSYVRFNTSALLAANYARKTFFQELVT